MATSGNNPDKRTAVGIFGGTFDPIHVGHLRVAREAFLQLALDELRFIPAAQPPLREVPVATAAQRAEMVRVAIQDEPGFMLDTRELDRGGTSYMVDTLASLRSELEDASLCLLIGQDQFAQIEHWHRWKELLELCHLVVLNRPGATAMDIPDWARACITASEEWRKLSAGKLVFLAIQPQDISATRIRERLAAGESVDQWLPLAVRDFIKSRHLYGKVGRSVECR